jgi:hypothetical protein
MDSLGSVVASIKKEPKNLCWASATETHVWSLVLNGRMGGHLGVSEGVPLYEHTTLVIARIQGFILKW